MAVRLADYYKNHQIRVGWAAGSMLVAINLTLLILFLFLGIGWVEALLLIMLPFVLMQVFMLIIILRYALEPLELLTRTITYVSPQPNNVTLPNLNLPRHKRTGLKTMVQTIYDRQPSDSDQSSSEILTELLDYLPCGVIMLDPKGAVVRFNKKAPVVVDSNNQPHITLQFGSNPSFEEWLKAATDSKLNDTNFWPQIQDRLPGEDDRRVHDVLAAYQKNGANDIDTVILTIDQTDRYVEDEKAIDFLSIAAHELRGPITIIRGYMDVLRNELESTLQPDQKQLIERIDVSAARLSGYVNNILNVAKYDRQHLKLHLHEDKLDDVYRSIADDLQLRARSQTRLLSVEIPSDLPTIAADRSSLSEVIANLVDNAIKYSHEGGQVIVSARVEGNFVRLSVQDFGVGIPRAVANHLFQKFYRSHRSKTSVAGTGLGLFISRAIVESHGGQIGATSTEGEGSTFSFTVPIYATVADRLAAGDNSNADIVQTSSGWIRNHSRIGG